MTKEVSLAKMAGLNWGKKTIILVEDADGNNHLIEAALSKTVAKVIPVRYGRDSIDIIRDKKGADLLIMDIPLPETDGYEIIRQVKTLWPDLPVLAQTPYIMTNRKGKLLQQACNEIIVKPFGLKDLLALCVNYLGT